MADTKQVKSQGEHWVCSVLAGLGWAVALTRDGVARTDVLATSTRGDAMIEVQVKAARYRSHPNWPINRKAQQVARSGREWFVLVALGADAWGPHRGFVVPRDHLAAATWISHRSWLTEPGIPPGQRTAGLDKARVAVETLVGYEDRWDLLDAPTGSAPVLLPETFRALIDEPRVGLPDGHPWHHGLPRWPAAEPRSS